MEHPTTWAEIKRPGDTVAKMKGRKRLGTLRKVRGSYRRRSTGMDLGPKHRGAKVLNLC